MDISSVPRCSYSITHFLYLSSERVKKVFWCLTFYMGGCIVCMNENTTYICQMFGYVSRVID